jgi:hypothetical protein
MLSSAAPAEFRRSGPLPPTLDPRQSKNQNLRSGKIVESHSAAVTHAVAGSTSAKPPQHISHPPGTVPDDSRPHPSRFSNDARSDANLEAVRERLAVLSQSFAAAHASAANMSNQASAHDRTENKQRKPQKPAPNAAPLGRLKAESSAGSVGSSVKGDDDWDEQDNGLLTLENFDQSGSSDSVILNSPRSIEVSAIDSFSVVFLRASVLIDVFARCCAKWVFCKLNC